MAQKYGHAFFYKLIKKDRSLIDGRHLLIGGFLARDKLVLCKGNLKLLTNEKACNPKY